MIEEESMNRNTRKSFRTSQLIGDFSNINFPSRRKSRISQYKILNPIANVPLCVQQSFVPQVPQHIKNQLGEIDYLTYNMVSALGTQSQGHNPLNRRTSRFSMRLLAMQKAMKNQQQKVGQVGSRTSMEDINSFSDPYANGNEDYFSMMEENLDSMQIPFSYGQMESNQDLMFCKEPMQDEDNETQGESLDGSNPINYEEYETYLDV